MNPRWHKDCDEFLRTGQASKEFREAVLADPRLENDVLYACVFDDLNLPENTASENPVETFRLIIALLRDVKKHVRFDQETNRDLEEANKLVRLCLGRVMIAQLKDNKPE